MSVAEGASYTNSSQQLLLRVLDHLGATPLVPQPLTDMAVTIGGSRDQVFRALKNLEQAGWAEQSGNAWQLSPTLTLLSERLRIQIAGLHDRYLNLQETDFGTGKKPDTSE